jgi:hypothetical protein
VRETSRSGNVAEGIYTYESGNNKRKLANEKIQNLQMSLYIIKKSMGLKQA